LFLPAREGDAFRAYLGVVAVRQGDDEVVDLGVAAGLVNGCVVCDGGLVDA
jgi:hypothetical protein